MEIKVLPRELKEGSRDHNFWEAEWCSRPRAGSGRRQTEFESCLYHLHVTASQNYLSEDEKGSHKSSVRNFISTYSSFPQLMASHHGLCLSQSLPKVPHQPATVTRGDTYRQVSLVLSLLSSLPPPSSL